MKLIYLLAGGVVGTASRYYLSMAVYKVFGTRFPYGTLAVNLLGCFIIGILAALFEDNVISPNGRILLMVGFCGAFTTFSTYILETSNLLKDGEFMFALVNICISTIVGFFLFHLGMMVAGLIRLPFKGWG